MWTTRVIVLCAQVSMYVCMYVPFFIAESFGFLSNIWGFHVRSVKVSGLLVCDTVSLVSVTWHKVLHTFKTSGNTNPLTQCHMPEDLNVHLIFTKLSVHLKYWKPTCDNTSTEAGWTFVASPAFYVRDEVFPVTAAGYCPSEMLER